MQEKDVNDMSVREFFEEIKSQERDDYEGELKNLLLSYFALKYSKLLEKYSKPEELENIPSDETAYIKGRFMNIIHKDVDSTLPGITAKAPRFSLGIQRPILLKINMRHIFNSSHRTNI